MPEKIKFTSESDPLAEYQKKIEMLKERDGFMLEGNTEKGKNIISFLGLKEGLAGKTKELVVEFETDIESEEELREIATEIQQTPLFRKILTFIAETEKENRIPLIQSVPGTGKTFAYKKFNELLHGRKADREYLACTPKTNELDIIGHWAPEGGAGETADVKQILAKSEKWCDFQQSFEQKLENLSAQKNALSEEEFNKSMSKLTEEYAELQRKVLEASDKKTAGWAFHKGALLAGFKDPNHPEDEGRMIIIDEIDNLPENYQNIFLQISGTEAELADEITSYSNSGIIKYKRGKNTFVGFAANYPELATGKRAISAPLADRVDWLSITPEESLEDEQLRIESFSFSDLEKKRMIIGTEKKEMVENKGDALAKYKKIEIGFSQILKEADPRVASNIRQVLSRSLALLHVQWKTSLTDYRKEGMETPGGKPRMREQDKEFSQRAVAGIEKALFKNLDNPAYINPSTGRIDIAEIFFDAFQAKYLNFLASKELRLKFQREQILPVLYGGKKEMVETDEGIELKEIPEVQDNVFLYVEDENGIFRSYTEKDKGKQAFSIEEVLNILVERASIPEEEKQRLMLEKQERQKREAQQRSFDIEDIVEDFKKEPGIPEEIKKLL